jgi:3-oxoacyl-[acyl-carrier-protein] synthase II
MHQIPSGMFFKIMSHTAAANIAQTFNVKGRVISPNAACSSSAQAIGMGYEFIRNGIQDVMLCGGVDELHPMTNVSFDIVQAASYKFNEQPHRTPRPFDKDRDGTVCGEGAGCIVLESEESALKRGARILGEVVGFSTSSSGVHMAQADADSIAVCINDALKSAQLQPGDVDYINAHATGTLVGDVSEALAIKQVFAEKVPVSSLKGYFGHTLGASGVLEMIVSFSMMEEEILLPTLNLDEPDEACTGIWHLREKREQKINTFVKNSFAFGGINTVLIGKRYAE